MIGPDRLQLMLAATQTRVTGIDFVEVQPNQTVLDVYFLKDPGSVAPSLVNDLTADQIRIYSPSGGERIAEAEIAGLAWPAAAGAREFLQITVAEPGDFSLYRLFIDDLRIDRYFNDVKFSFKVSCPTDVDCAPTTSTCPTEELTPAIDYLARDFWSYRRALLDFASTRWPDWQERLEADVGVMFAELMSATGDELAYYQDRVAREAHLETATQRRSIRRHARLVDYEMHDGLAASGWVEITAAAGAGLTIAAGTRVEARDDAGTVTPFEIGTSLEDTLSGRTFALDDRRNAIGAHVWDEDDTCLACGATEVYLQGNVAALLPLDDTPADQPPGRWVFLRATPLTAGVPERRHLVRLIEVTDTESDGSPMFDQVQNLPVTRLTWDAQYALPFEMELTTFTVRGNVVPVIAGEQVTAAFTIGSVIGSTDPTAVERQGANGSIAFLFTLPDDAERGVCRRGTDPHKAIPEIHLEEGTGASLRTWEWRRSLIGSFGEAVGTSASLAYDLHYTIEDGTWSTTAQFDRAGEVLTHVDYTAGTGTTIRFGDGVFGRVPTFGTQFTVRFRVGNGPTYNVAADALVYCTHAAVTAITNPIACAGGLGQETLAEVQSYAPQAFQAVTYRAVRPEDYAEAAERLSWVQRAGSRFRWTGSWLSAFVTPDPLNAFSLEQSRRRELTQWLDRFRQAGRETHVSDPVYANLDLEITVRVEATAYRGEVRQSLKAALFGPASPGQAAPFFSPDRFSFGDALDRSALEAALHVSGVCAVERVRLRRRGWTDWADLVELQYEVAPHEIVRVQNDPNYPERGSLRLILTGGA